MSYRIREFISVLLSYLYQVTFPNQNKRNCILLMFYWHTFLLDFTTINGVFVHNFRTQHNYKENYCIFHFLNWTPSKSPKVQSTKQYLHRLIIHRFYLHIFPKNYPKNYHRESDFDQPTTKNTPDTLSTKKQMIKKTMNQIKLLGISGYTVSAIIHMANEHLHGSIISSRPAHWSHQTI